MKTNNLFYILSLLLLAASLFLMVNYPESNRMYLIAGVLIPIGFVINILSFFTKKRV
ncbi:hypothetical protein L3049_18820 [Labilibaculum sp. DW002]|uniref:Uncharacterized protein n=1 Tax=Paralabilibaculum antarcticum TaxID=2912572 RepID=A0ABT5VX98_9BACT|nr:hypothetical protein [Labilibaculum sp. DW002]MDE5420048.1 hypothetical protein [Labilibaculum sp. DW002]